MAGKRGVVRQGIALLVTAWLVASSSSAAGEPIKVHLREGNARGFLVLHTAEGAPIAYGEFRQKPAGAMIESQLVLRFGDGSLRDEVATFSQAGNFRLEAYRLVQRGPSFPTAEISFARRTGQYTARTQEKKGDEEQTASGALEMPTDLYNGMAMTLLKNLPVSGRAAAQMAVFTPTEASFDQNDAGARDRGGRASRPRAHGDQSISGQARGDRDYRRRRLAARQGASGRALLVCRG